MPVGVALRRNTETVDGLRSRKKLRTARAIEDAALELFAARGFEATTVEQIASRAEVSTTTFFRYFPSKADVVLTNWGEGMPALHDAIVERPRAERDLTAIRRALEQEWLTHIDPQLTVRIASAVGTSPLLRGLSYEVGEQWLASISNALAQRRGLAMPDQRCSLTARVALEVWADAVEGWIVGGATGDLASAIAHGFNLVAELAGDWAKRPR
jgi:AcrR family transcriptional regulator